jgi:hypothetical protein
MNEDINPNQRLSAIGESPPTLRLHLLFQGNRDVE